MLINDQKNSLNKKILLNDQKKSLIKKIFINDEKKRILIYDTKKRAISDGNTIVINNENKNGTYP